MTTTTTTRPLLLGPSVLRTFLRSHRSDLAQAPILIISSHMGDDPSQASVVPEVERSCHKAQFLTAMEFGLRTVPSQLTSVFPTGSDVQSRIELMKRTGAATVLGVGSGAAMDLAKAVADKVDGASAILVPSTYGAILASASSHALLLDPKEEALEAQETILSNNCNIILETDYLSKRDPRHAAWACLAIGVDALYRKIDTTEVQASLELGIKALEDESHLVGALSNAGQVLSYGLVGTRSSPLAFATSLIPPLYPNCSVLTFMASLLPGICQAFPASSEIDQQVRRLCVSNHGEIPTLASLALQRESAQSVQTLLSYVRSNQALWDCWDIDDDVQEAILHHSLNR